MKVFTLIARWFSRSQVVDQVEAALKREHFSLGCEVEQLFKRQNAKLQEAFERVEAREDRILAQLNSAELKIAELRKTHGELLQDVGMLQALVKTFTTVAGDHFDSATSNRVTVSKKLDVLMERPFHNLRELKAAIGAQLEKELGKTAPATMPPAPEPVYYSAQEFMDKPELLNLYSRRQFQRLEWYDITRGQLVARATKLAAAAGIELRSTRVAKWRKMTSTYPVSILSQAGHELIEEAKARRNSAV